MMVGYDLNEVDMIFVRRQPRRQHHASHTLQPILTAHHLTTTKEQPACPNMSTAS
jgi:hypothetical protein